MASPTSAALVRAHLEAFSSGDLPAMLATMAPDAVFRSGTTLVDPAEFEDFFGWAIRQFRPSMRITSIVADDHNVACEFVESVTVEGERRDLARAAFYTLDGGVITAVTVYDLTD